MQKGDAATGGGPWEGHRLPVPGALRPGHPLLPHLEPLPTLPWHPWSSSSPPVPHVPACPRPAPTPSPAPPRPSLHALEGSRTPARLCREPCFIYLKQELSWATSGMCPGAGTAQPRCVNTGQTRTCVSLARAHVYSHLAVPALTGPLSPGVPASAPWWGPGACLSLKDLGAPGAGWTARALKHVCSEC